jgi:peroxidase
VVSERGGHGAHDPSANGVSSITVQLDDSSGNVLTTTVTDRAGHYSFNQLTGECGTGDYTVRLVVPSGFTQSSKNPSTIVISRGGIDVKDVNFVLASS